MENGSQLSRRERQIMDVLYQRGRATVAQVRAELPKPPSYSTVRTLLGVLERKGHVRHEADGTRRYVFLPTTPRSQASRSALRRILYTFFENSTEAAVAALLDLSKARLTESEFRRLTEMIEQARREGR